MSDPLAGRNIAVYVGGSVAAFKAAGVVTELRRRGAGTRVVMTPGAQRFVTPLTLQSLSGHPVVTDLWTETPGAAPGDAEHGMHHLSVSAWAEAQIAVAATANLIARLALGLADDAVTATALACVAPLLVVPAMESAMWNHPATRANVAVLQERGAVLVGPVSGRLASGKDGDGRMAEVEEIISAAGALFRA